MALLAANTKVKILAGQWKDHPGEGVVSGYVLRIDGETGQQFQASSLSVDLARSTAKVTLKSSKRYGHTGTVTGYMVKPTGQTKSYPYQPTSVSEIKPPSAAFSLALTDDKTAAKPVNVPAAADGIKWARSSVATGGSDSEGFEVLSTTSSYSGSTAKPYIGAIPTKGGKDLSGASWVEPRLKTTPAGPPPPPPPPPPALSGLKRGIIGGSNYSTPDQLAKIKQVGANWTRNDTPTREFVDTVAGLGLTCLPIIYDDASYASKFPELEWFEHRNEPYWGPGVAIQSPEETAQSYVACRNKMRAINPKAKLLLAVDELSYWGTDSIQRMTNAVPNLWTQVDGIAVHPYSSGTDPADLGTNDWQVNRVTLWRDKCMSHGLPASVGWWLTEVGWTTMDFGAYPPASYMTHLQQWVEGRPWVAAVMIYQVQDQNTNGDNREHTFGQFTSSWGAKPQAQPLATWYKGRVGLSALDVAEEHPVMASRPGHLSTESGHHHTLTRGEAEKMIADYKAAWTPENDLPDVDAFEAATLARVSTARDSIADGDGAS